MPPSKFVLEAQAPVRVSWRSASCCLVGMAMGRSKPFAAYLASVLASSWSVLESLADCLGVFEGATTAVGILAFWRVRARVWRRWRGRMLGRVWRLPRRARQRRVPPRHGRAFSPADLRLRLMPPRNNEAEGAHRKGGLGFIIRRICNPASFSCDVPLHHWIQMA